MSDCQTINVSGTFHWHWCQLSVVNQCQWNISMPMAVTTVMMSQWHWCQLSVVNQCQWNISTTIAVTTVIDVTTDIDVTTSLKYSTCLTGLGTNQIARFVTVPSQKKKKDWIWLATIYNIVFFGKVNLNENTWYHNKGAWYYQTSVIQQHDSNSSSSPCEIVFFTFL